jgi:hypothetical protein
MGHTGLLYMTKFIIDLLHELGVAVIANLLIAGAARAWAAAKRQWGT